MPRVSVLQWDPGAIPSAADSCRWTDRLSNAQRASGRNTLRSTRENQAASWREAAKVRPRHQRRQTSADPLLPDRHRPPRPPLIPAHRSTLRGRGSRSSGPFVRVSRLGWFGLRAPSARPYGPPGLPPERVQWDAIPPRPSATQPTGPPPAFAWPDPLRASAAPAPCDRPISRETPRAAISGCRTEPLADCVQRTFCRAATRGKNLYHVRQVVVWAYT
jgi:hypothetical protein